VVGRKRHILTDTLGLLLAVRVHPASVQDRDGAEALLREARRSFPFIERIIGDAGYQGRKMEAAIARTGTWELQIVRRCDRHRSSCSQNAGSWSVPSPGSAVAVGSPAITNVTPAKPPRSSASP
jgi:transposase